MLSDSERVFIRNSNPSKEEIGKDTLHWLGIPHHHSTSDEEITVNLSLSLLKVHGSCYTIFRKYVVFCQLSTRLFALHNKQAEQLPQDSSVLSA